MRCGVEQTSGARLGIIQTTWDHVATPFTAVFTVWHGQIADFGVHTGLVTRYGVRVLARVF